MRRTRVAPALLVAAGLALAGCGSEDGSSERVADSPTPVESAEASAEPSDPSAAASSQTASLPDCADVWVAGATLPRRYQGCTEDGVEVGPESRICSIGTRLYTHGDRFYAVPDGPVQEATPVLLEDPDYRQVLAVCTG